MARSGQTKSLSSVPLRACITGFSSLLAGLAHGAPLPTPAGLPVSPAASEAPAALVPAKEVYIDRVMEGLPATDDALKLKQDDYNASGWPRSWHVDYSLITQKGFSSSTAKSIGLSGFLDTPDYGVLSVNASTTEQQLDSPNSQTPGRGTTWRLDQRAVPFDGGWRGNFSAGDISAGVVPMARAAGRMSLPSTQIRGLNGQLYLNDSAEINVAKGPAGLFRGLDVSGFEKLGGQLTSVGGQFKLPSDYKADPSNRTDVAFQFIDGKDLTYNGSAGTTQNTQGLWLSTAWEGAAPWTATLGRGTGPASDRQGGLRVQGNLIQSNSTQDGRALGVWADAAWRTERWRHAAGTYRFEPLLRWGTSVVASDIQGVYWRADTASRQWQASFSSDFSNNLSGAGGSSGASAFYSANGRYRINSRNAISATLSIKALSGSGQAVAMNWDQINDWGQTQWRGDFAHTVLSQTSRLGVDHNWPVSAPTTFNTSLALERTTGSDSPGTGLIWGLLGSWSPLSQWSLDTSLRGATRSNGSESVNANIGLNWQPYSSWSLSMRYTESRGKEPLSPLLVSALTSALQPAIVSTPASRSLQLILSYSGRAGLATAPIGGAPGSGAGSLSGAVFFDADNNGKREATEGGVAGVTVILDRRYVTRTDAQGKYSFPFVAAGQHLVEISSDNVPLPWSPLLRDAVKTDVLVRDTTILDFAVQKEK